jgi:hypothetical protein
MKAKTKRGWIVVVTLPEIPIDEKLLEKYLENWEV